MKSLLILALQIALDFVLSVLMKTISPQAMLLALKNGDDYPDRRRPLDPAPLQSTENSTSLQYVGLAVSGVTTMATVLPCALAIIRAAAYTL